MKVCCFKRAPRRPAGHKHKIEPSLSRARLLGLLGSFYTTHTITRKVCEKKWRYSMHDLPLVVRPLGQAGIAVPCLHPMWLEHSLQLRCVYQYLSILAGSASIVTRASTRLVFHQVCAQSAEEAHRDPS
jgi:hypothetical protein